MHTKKIPRWLPLSLLLFVGLCAWRLWPDPGIFRVKARFAGSALGTTYHVSVVGTQTANNEASATEDFFRAHMQVRGKIDGVLAQIDMQMSTWRSDSEVARFNASASTAPFPVSNSTSEVVREALRIGQLTNGAFDITMVPLLRLWGFGHNAATQATTAATMPSVNALTKAAEMVGVNMVEVDLDKGSLRKRKPGVEIDLSAIAKGYAVDRIALTLEHMNIDAYMVEVGGEIRVHGQNEHHAPWRIGIETPDAAHMLNAEHLRVLNVEDGAVATSGDYRNFYEIDGKRYSHTIDPRTQRPVAHALTSVTIVGKSCMLADAWATAITVLGPIEGMRLAEREGIEALLVVHEGKGYRQSMSSAFTRHFGKKQ